MISFIVVIVLGMINMIESVSLSKEAHHVYELVICAIMFILSIVLMVLGAIWPENIIVVQLITLGLVWFFHPKKEKHHG